MSSLSDTEEIFTTPESEARLDLIRHLIENSELVPLVRGVSGIGKSLLASRLQAGAPSNWAVCHFGADSMMQPERLLTQIARCYGLPDAKDENLQRLEERFKMLRNRGTVPVLLIDDAQELPPTSLITLLRLYERQAGGAPLVSLVLFANEQIDMLLSTPQLQIMSPKSIQVIDLPPLTREEADAFMQHLLQAEGLDQRLALDSNRLTRIHRETGGAPGQMARAILEGVGESGSVSMAAMKGVHPMIWGLMALGIMLLLLAAFQESVVRMISVESPPANVVAKETPGSAETLSGTLASTQTEPETPIQPMPLEPVSTGSIPEPIPSSSIAERPPASDQVETEMTPGGAAPASTEETAGATVADGLVSPPETLAGLQPAEDTATSSANEIPPVPAPVVAEPAVEAEQGDAAMPMPDPLPDPVQTPIPEVTVAVPEVKAPAATEPSDERASILKSPEWLAQQAPENHTVQLLAVENIDSIHDVIVKHNLQGKAFTVRTERKGRAWYPLLWGNFADRKEAETALKGLDPKLQRGGVWIRTISSLMQ